MKIRIRHAADDDCRDLWLWRNHSEVRKWCFAQGAIEYGVHKDWFDRKIRDTNTVIYIAESISGEKVGQVRFSFDKDNGNISINLNPDFFGKGLGAEVIHMATDNFLIEKNTVKTVIAEIMDGNIASWKAFEKAGYAFFEKATKDGRIVNCFIYRNSL